MQEEEWEELEDPLLLPVPPTMETRPETWAEEVILETEHQLAATAAAAATLETVPTLLPPAAAATTLATGATLRPLAESRSSLLARRKVNLPRIPIPLHLLYPPPPQALEEEEEAAPPPPPPPPPPPAPYPLEEAVLMMKESETALVRAKVTLATLSLETDEACAPPKPPREVPSLAAAAAAAAKARLARLAAEEEIKDFPVEDFTPVTPLSVAASLAESNCTTG